MIKFIDILNEAEISKCPPATQNIELNLQNRQKAINEYGYGPLIALLTAIAPECVFE